MGTKDGSTFQTRIYEQYAFGIADDFARLNLEEVKEFDGIVLRKTEPYFTRYQIRTIRTARDEGIYLVPLFVLGNIEDLDGLVKPLVDGQIASVDNLKQASEQVLYIKERRKAL